MADSTPAVSALVFGLDAICGARHNFANIDLNKLFHDLRLSEDTLRRTPGVNARFHYFDIDDKDDVEGLRKVIREGDDGGRPWDTIAIGFGVRGNPDLTVPFEELVNYAKDAVPTAKLTFTSSPTGYLEAFKRWFPQIGQTQ